MDSLPLPLIGNAAGLLALGVLVWWRTGRTERDVLRVRDGQVELHRRLDEVGQDVAYVRGQLDVLFRLQGMTYPGAKS